MLLFSKYAFQRTREPRRRMESRVFCTIASIALADNRPRPSWSHDVSSERTRKASRQKPALHALRVSVVAARVTGLQRRTGRRSRGTLSPMVPLARRPASTLCHRFDGATGWMRWFPIANQEYAGFPGSNRPTGSCVFSVSRCAQGPRPPFSQYPAKGGCDRGDQGAWSRSVSWRAEGDRSPEIALFGLRLAAADRPPSDVESDWNHCRRRGQRLFDPLSSPPHGRVKRRECVARWPVPRRSPFELLF